MIAYASRTGTRRNLAALRSAGWRLLVSAAGAHRTEGFDYALDNGAWTAYSQRRPWDKRRFLAALNKLGGSAEWVVLPDIVTGGRRSLDLSMSWARRVLDVAPYAMLAVQDGMHVIDVRSIIGGRIGIFIGGSTHWKLSTLAMWCALANEIGCLAHVARVNSARRIAHAAHAGADSFDGTSASKYAVTVPPLDAANRQSCLKWGWSW